MHKVPQAYTDARTLVNTGRTAGYSPGGTITQASGPKAYVKDGSFSSIVVVGGRLD